MSGPAQTVDDIRSALYMSPTFDPTSGVGSVVLADGRTLHSGWVSGAVIAYFTAEVWHNGARLSSVRASRREFAIARALRRAVRPGDAL